MSFLDFIFDNLFIVIVIVIGIVNYINYLRKNEKSDTQERKNVGTGQRQQTSPSRNQSDPKGQVLGRFAEEIEKKVSSNAQTSHTESFEQQRRAQYERLKQNIQSEATSLTNQQYEPKTMSDSEVANATKKHQTDENTKKQPAFSLEDKLTKQGLMESIIMAEVLGSPRALKPYQNIVLKRRTK